MRGIIIYTSKYGATKQYAAWLNQKLSLPAVSSDEVLKNELKKYDCILLGTPVYFGKFKLKKWLERNANALINKKIFLFIVNATAPGEVEKRNNFIEHNVPAEIKPYCKYYFLPGRVVHKTLSVRDRFILQLAGRFEKDPIKKRALHQDLDGVKKENLLPLINEVQLFCRNKAAWEIYMV